MYKCRISELQNSHFQNEVKCKDFPLKNEFYLLESKNSISISSFALSLVWMACLSSSIKLIDNDKQLFFVLVLVIYSCRIEFSYIFSCTWANKIFAEKVGRGVTFWKGKREVKVIVSSLFQTFSFQPHSPSRFPRTERLEEASRGNVIRHIISLIRKRGKNRIN